MGLYSGGLIFFFFFGGGGGGEGGIIIKILRYFVDKDSTVIE